MANFDDSCNSESNAALVQSGVETVACREVWCGNKIVHGVGEVTGFMGRVAKRFARDKALASDVGRIRVGLLRSSPTAAPAPVGRTTGPGSE